MSSSHPRQIQSPGDCDEQATLARACGGITYQPIYTFQDRIRPCADELRGDLLRSSASPLWSPKGFQVSIEAGAKVKIKHVTHPKWYALVSESDIYFQYDVPSEDELADILRVQADILNKVSTRLGVEALNSLGTKFISLIPIQNGVSAVDRLRYLLVLDPHETLLKDRINPVTEIAFRLGYRFGSGTAALQVSSDASGKKLMVDLDCYCTDVFALKGDYLQFMMEALTHFSTDVKSFLAPLLTNKSRSVTEGASVG